MALAILSPQARGMALAILSPLLGGMAFAISYVLWLELEAWLLPSLKSSAWRHGSCHLKSSAWRHGLRHLLSPLLGGMALAIMERSPLLGMHL